MQCYLEPTVSVSKKGILGSKGHIGIYQHISLHIGMYRDILELVGLSASKPQCDGFAYQQSIETRVSGTLNPEP